MSDVVWSPALHSAIKMYKLQEMKEDLSEKLQTLGLLPREKEKIKNLLHQPLKAEDVNQLDHWF